MSKWQPGIPQKNNPAREVVTFYQHTCPACGEVFDVGERMVLYWSSPGSISYLHPACAEDAKVAYAELPALSWSKTGTGRIMAAHEGDEYEIRKEGKSWGLVKNDDIPLYLGSSMLAAYGIADLDAFMPNYMPPGFLSGVALPGRAKPGAIAGKTNGSQEENSTMAVATKSASKKSDKKPAKAETKPVKEKAVTASATEEEFQAAVNGTLKPRSEAGSRNQEALKAKSDDGKPSGRPLGITTGLPIRMYWILLAQRNEAAPKNKKMTDEQIADALRKEYPGRDSAVFDAVQYVRRQFNAGVLTRGMKPKWTCYKYDAEGNRVEGRGNGDAKKGTPAKKKDAGIKTIDSDGPSEMSKIRNSPGIAQANKPKKKVLKA